MAEASSRRGLQIEHLAVRRGARLVVDDVSLHAPAGRLTALLGPNGAGKSTVLKAAAGLLPSAGRVLFDGTDAVALDPRARARRLAYVPQHSSLDAPLPVREVVAQGRFAHHDGLGATLGAADRHAIDAALARTAATALADRAFGRLSYGERRRVLLARALATGATTLLLDEPTAGLDVGQALALFATLRSLAAEGATLLLVLHQLDEAARFTDRLVLLDAGRVQAAGAPGEVLTPELLRRIYGVEPLDDGALGFRLVSRGGSP
jgi:iron complex transport system ATP-binding protein